MPINISRPNRNHRVARMNLCEQIRGCAGGATMVRDFKQHRVRVLFYNPAFSGAFGITLKQGGGCTESGAEDQAIVIRPHRARYLVSPRRQHMKMRSAVVDLISLFLY